MQDDGNDGGRTKEVVELTHFQCQAHAPSAVLNGHFVVGERALYPV